MASSVALGLACSSTRASRPALAIPSAAELAKSYGLEIRPEAADGVPIRVVDAASGKPVGDALVVSVDESEFTYADSGDAGRTWNAHSLLKEYGQAYVTSRDGTVRVANPEELRAAFVWHGNDFGRTMLEVHDHAEHLVSMAPRSLMVEVVDKAGRPQSGIPVQLGKCSLEPMSAATTVGTTGSDGRFAIPPLELERGVHRSCGRRDLVMLGCLVSGYELRAVDRAKLEPVRMVLPDCGTVEVEIQDAQGRPISKDSKPGVRLSLLIDSVRLGAACGPERKPSEDDERSLFVPVDGASYRLDHVEVGRHLTFWLKVEKSSSYSDDGLHPIDSKRQGPVAFPGPTRAGETKHVVLRAESFGSEEDQPTSVEAQVTRSEKSPNTTTGDADSSPAKSDEHSSIDIAVQLDVPIEACWLSARLDDNRDPYDHETCPWIDVNGCATIRGVPAGTHSVTITERRIYSNDYADVPLCRIDDVLVAPSQHLRDPRLLNIDLRGKLRVHHLEISDGDGHPLSGFVRFTRDGDRDFADQMWFRDGHVSFLTGVDDGVRASVGVNRFRKRPLDLTSSGPAGAPRQVYMERGIGVRLVFDRQLKLPDAPHDSIYIGVSEMPHWFEWLEFLRTVELRPGADLNFRVAEPGDWKVIFLRSHDSGDNDPEVSECPSVETTISVEDTGAGVVQFLDVKPDHERWNELLRSIGDGN